jgi:hypothetical protein
MEGDIETAHGIDVLNGIFHRSPAQVGKIDRVFGVDRNDVVPIGIRGRTLAGIGDDADPVQWRGPVHIIDRPMDGDLAESPVSGDGR